MSPVLTAGPKISWSALPEERLVKALSSNAMYLVRLLEAVDERERVREASRVVIHDRNATAAQLDAAMKASDSADGSALAYLTVFAGLMRDEIGRLSRSVPDSEDNASRPS